MKTVGVHTYVPGERTSYGYRQQFWDPPLDEPGTEVSVYGWAPRSTSESGVNPENLVLTDVDLLAPAGTIIGPDDVVDLPDGQFQVVGYPQDYSSGPFGPGMGEVVKLKRSGPAPAGGS